MASVWPALARVRMAVCIVAASASAVGDQLPLTALPLRLLATAVAYSRVHTGVHYPGDAVTSSLIGTVTAVAVRHLIRARP